MKLEKPRDISLPTGVLGLASTPDNSRLYAACMDGQIFEIDPASGAASAFQDKHSSYASGCVLLPDGKTVISGGYDGSLLWHDVEKQKSFRQVKAHEFWSWQLALSPDGIRVASVTGQYLPGGEKYEPAPASEPTVKVFDTRTGDLVHAFEHLPPVLSTAFSPDGQHLAAANMMGEVRIWELATGRQVAAFTSPDFTSWGIIKSPHYLGGIYGLAFAPDSTSLLCCGMGPMADPMAGNGKMTWQRWAWRETPAKMLDQVHDGEHGSGLMETLAHLPDGSAFLMAGRQAQGTWNAALFSSTDGKLLASLDTKSRVTRSLVSHDGKSLLLAAAVGQSKKNDNGKWPDYGRIHIVPISA
ncbi:WD40 repeat domain-containing protein [Verrucomicrobiota bacterium sgz303538]